MSEGADGAGVVHLSPREEGGVDVVETLLRQDPWRTLRLESPIESSYLCSAESEAEFTSYKFMQKSLSFFFSHIM